MRQRIVENVKEIGNAGNVFPITLRKYRDTCRGR